MPSSFNRPLPLQLILIIAVLLATSCATPTEHNSPGWQQGNWIDLSHAFDSSTLYWPTAPTFVLDTAFEGITPGGYYYSAYNFRGAEHGGTHLDAPVHFARGKWHTDEIPLDNLTGAAVVINLREKVGDNADYQVQQSDIEAWENEHGPIPEGAILLLYSGWGSRYPDALRYLGTNLRGQEAVSQLHFPGISPGAAEWLVKYRKIKAVGLDTPSLDAGQSTDFRTHQILNGANICGFENVANLDLLPTIGAYVVALPMKIGGGSGAPLRIAAWVALPKS